MKLPVKYTSLDWKKKKVVREEYIKRQGGMCQHCGASLDSPPDDTNNNLVINKKLFPPNFFDYPIHLHHSHVTGLTIGAVHAKCNAILWQYHGE